MKCDIVMPVWNNLSFTKKCVESIFKNTDDVPYALIIIDNASDDETRKYLEGLKTDPRICLLRNEVNVGFLKAVNQGMKKSAAPYVCLINNDTIAAKGWLGEMIKAAESSPRIGLVNPSSNTLGQKLSGDTPIETYAGGIKNEPDLWQEIGSAIGFCMLIKREVIGKIGLFDEIYGMGNFEDTDYSRRAIKEGYICARACRAYVFHAEGSSFGRDRRFDEDFERNRQIYEFRWGRRRWIAYIIASFDGNTVKRLEKDIMPEVRKGLWVWYFSQAALDLPRHSNIVSNIFRKHFYLKTFFKVLTRKKKFSEIFVTDAAFARALELFSFIHRAKVNYY